MGKEGRGCREGESRERESGQVVMVLKNAKDLTGRKA